MAGAGDMARFADVELMQLRKDFEEHRREHDEQMKDFAREMAENTRVTMQLATSVENIARSTSGVVKLYRDVQGAASLGSGLQKFMLWLLKWGLIGTSLAGGIMWVLDRFRA